MKLWYFIFTTMKLLKKIHFHWFPLGWEIKLLQCGLSLLQSFWFWLLRFPMLQMMSLFALTSSFNLIQTNKYIILASVRWIISNATHPNYQLINNAKTLTKPNLYWRSWSKEEDTKSGNSINSRGKIICWPKAFRIHRFFLAFPSMFDMEKLWEVWR